MSDGAHSSRVERLQPWFALQLQFADVFASKSGLPLDAAVTFFTNLHRRFGFGRPSKDGRSPIWEGFVRELVALPTQAERVECTKAFAREHLTSWLGTPDRQFGCFSYEMPREGNVRIHFGPHDDGDGVGPLSHLKSARRVEELTEMFAFIRQEHPEDARYVVGGSWLYNLDAYRRLFPSAYIDSLRIHTAPSTLAGGSWWGQFLDHDENIVPERVTRFLQNLRFLDPEKAWMAFPMRVMTARAEASVFFRHYAARTRLEVT